MIAVPTTRRLIALATRRLIALATGRLIALAIVAMLSNVAMAQTPSLLKIFSRDAAEAIDGKSVELSEEEGPWMILASTFVGEGSQARAERLAKEIREEMKLPAFVYREKFDFTGTVNQDPTTSKRLRYANRYQYEAYAVLAGEYDTVEHPNIERDLKRIRTANPAVFQDPNEVAAETDRSTPVTTVKSITAKLFGQNGNGQQGPMSQAFVTRNPLLPEEYFSAPEVDSFVHQMNDGLHHSLLDCKGKYTVVVKTFEGLGTIVDGKHEKDFQPSQSRLNKFAVDAEKMTKELREQGVEAYQFHDRFRSLVTVGSFDVLGRELPDGKFEYAPEIQEVVKKFSAFNVDPAVARQVPSGTRGVVSNGVAQIPFDVQPMPIVVPKVSKRSLYGAALGMR